MRGFSFCLERAKTKGGGAGFERQPLKFAKKEGCFDKSF